MRINSRGEVTIPAEIRRKAGLLPGTEVEITYDGEAVRVTKIAGSVRGTGESSDSGGAGR